MTLSIRLESPVLRMPQTQNPALSPAPAESTPQAPVSLHAAARACDQAADDWDLLYPAMVDRLQQLIDAAPGAAVAPGNVHDCQVAMEQLHGLLLQERSLRRRIEAELRVAQGALAASRIELAGTRAGERSARHRADHDSLTSLPNRSVFHERLQALLSGAGAGASVASRAGGVSGRSGGESRGESRGEGRGGDTGGGAGGVGGAEQSADDSDGVDMVPAAMSLAVLFVDLDGFKPINDSHGHATGDELLRVVAERLSRAIRTGDLVCRLGGDEFACIVVQPMGHAQLRAIAAKLFDAVSAPLSLGPLLLNVRPSIGIAVYPSDGGSADTLLRKADSAMYRAKRLQSGWAFHERGVEPAGDPPADR